MPQLVEVRFKGNRKAYFEWHEPEPLRVAEPVLVEAERGLDFGTVSATGPLAERKCERCRACGLSEAAEGRREAARRAAEPIRRVVRRAGADDRSIAADQRRNEEDVRRKVREKALARGLAMKISDAEWQWDRSRLTVYFTAEQRVDFRALVRDLASQFRTRIELRQIGARDEAVRLSGIGRCGREYCSASWLPELRPIGLHLAKEQRLSLNPAQISGPCGRLLCCLRFEHEFYVQNRRRFPKEGKAVRTARGAELVTGIDIFRDRVSLRGEDGSSRTVALEDLKREMQAAPGDQAAPAAAAPTPEPAALAASASPGARPEAESDAAAPPPSPPDQPGRSAAPERRPRRRRRRHRGGGGSRGPAAP